MANLSIVLWLILFGVCFSLKWCILELDVNVLYCTNYAVTVENVKMYFFGKKYWTFLFGLYYMVSTMAAIFRVCSSFFRSRAPLNEWRKRNKWWKFKSTVWCAAETEESKQQWEKQQHWWRHLFSNIEQQFGYSLPFLLSPHHWILVKNIRTHVCSTLWNEFWGKLQKNGDNWSIKINCANEFVSK